MVDVWNELGKAVGRTLKPLADLSSAIWTGFTDSAGDIVHGFLDGIDDLQESATPVMEALMPSVLEEATAALGENSPDPKVKKAVDDLVAQLMKTIEKDSKTKHESIPSKDELAKRQASLIGGVLAMYAATHAVSMALDATQPLKDWGFKSAAMDLMYQFDMSKVVGPMIQAPIWSSVIVPLRYRANSDYPHQIPGTGILPYLMAKNIITSDAYEENMRYNAYDETWSKHMLENTFRYPSFSELRTMVHRGSLTVEDLKIAMAKSLIKTEYLDKYKDMIPSIPGVGDLVRFAVREAYPDMVGFEAHYAKMSEWMGKTGYDQYFADAFWTAHWIIPTVSQADDMLHRGMIDDEAHRALYILNDIRPEDIDSLRALTWKLPGRIEARWMFRWGEIDASDLRDLLVKDGLDPEYADSVASAMAKNQFLSDINRQIANIKTDYSRGYSTEATLRGDLSALGMRSEIVEYHVVDALEDRERSIHDEELKTLRSQYARGAFTMAQIITAVTPIIIDKVVRDAWLEALPSAKSVMIVEETYGTEVNRLVTNAKYDYVRGYTLIGDLTSRLQFLNLPLEIIQYHIMDADEDRARSYKDKSLKILEEGYIDDLMDWPSVEEMARVILVDEEAYNIWLDGVWLNKHKAVRVFAGE